MTLSFLFFTSFHIKSHYTDKQAQNTNTSSNQQIDKRQGSQSKLKKIFVETLKNIRTIKSKSEHDDLSGKTSKLNSNNEIDQDYEQMMYELNRKKEKRIKIVKEIKEMEEKGVMKWERKKTKLNLIKDAKVLSSKQFFL